MCTEYLLNFFCSEFCSFQNYSCQIFMQFSFKHCKFQPFYPQKMTLMYMYITANTLGSTHPITVMRSIYLCVALPHCISELWQEFWGTSPEQPAVFSGVMIWKKIKKKRFVIFWVEWFKCYMIKFEYIIIEEVKLFNYFNEIYFNIIQN